MRKDATKSGIAFNVNTHALTKQTHSKIIEVLTLKNRMMVAKIVHLKQTK